MADEKKMTETKPNDAQDEQERIEQAAYEIWLSEGKPDGKDEEHWFEAKWRISERMS